MTDKIKPKALSRDELKKEWHPTKNGSEELTEKTPVSRIAWWKCPLGHDFTRPLSQRLKGSSCSVCSGRALGIGFNDLATVRPDIAAQWHPTKNGMLLPSQVTVKDTRKVWWLGNCGHYWESAIYDRCKGRGCHYCSGYKVLAGFNDLEFLNPEVARQWHPTRNGSLLPSEVNASSPAPAWWLGGCGHYWKSSPNDRKRYGCKYCSGNAVWEGFNDLASRYPEIAAQWHTTKNGLKRPNEFTYGSGKLVWWTCYKGHEWDATIGSRTTLKAGCPDCFNISFTSKAEKEIYDQLISWGLTVERCNRKILSKNQELDLYLSDLQIAIEFNGIYWHSEWNKPKNYHRKKFEVTQSKGISLIQIWEDDWRLSKEIVLNTLKQKIKVQDEDRLSVKTEKVQKTTRRDAENFCKQNSVAIKDRQLIRKLEFIGKYEGNELVALIGYKKSEIRTTVYLYASSKNYGSNFNLLVCSIKELSSDLCLLANNDDGMDSFYRVQGFITVETINEECWKVTKATRQYVEQENLPSALRNRVWDAGKTLYRLEQ